MSRSRIIAAMVCSLGGLVFGYDLGALSTAAPSLRQTFHLSPLHFGLTVASSLWGTVCGSVAAGRIADRTGTPRLVSACATLYLVAAAAVFSPLLTRHWVLFLSLRFLCGLAIGGFTVGCPLYLAEMSPALLRGLFVGSFQLQVGIGILLAFATGVAETHLFGGGLYWRVPFELGRTSGRSITAASQTDDAVAAMACRAPSLARGGSVSRSPGAYRSRMAPKSKGRPDGSQLATS